MALALSEAKNTAISPTSLPVGSLFKAALSLAKSDINLSGSNLAGEYFSNKASDKPSVLINTGQSAFTRMPRGPSSLDKD